MIEVTNLVLQCRSVGDEASVSVAQTMGGMDDAVAHFEDSLAFCRKAGARPELAWTCHDYADVLLQRDDPGDHARATTLLEESLSISHQLGMRPLMKRVIALQEKVRSQPARRLEYPGGLTEREVEVLRLVAQGKSNPEIADELFIAVRTVTTHITSILNKTNCANRTEATAYAYRHNLV